MKNPAAFTFALVVWVGVSALGFWRLWEYETTPGTVSASPQGWPAGASVRLDPTKPTLVVFIHPRCPCTRASIDELERFMTHCQGLLTVHVLVAKPGHFPAGWEKTGLQCRAAAIPGVSVHSDVDGLEAARFGASTSGDARLFDCRGRLLFRGGLTNTRGHAGDSVGTRAIRDLMSGTPAPTTETPVYGCPLCQPESPTMEASWKR